MPFLFYKREKVIMEGKSMLFNFDGDSIEFGDDLIFFYEHLCEYNACRDDIKRKAIKK
jgi:hypothetical protein